MPAQTGTLGLRSQDHCRRVPTNDVLDPFFNIEVTRIMRLLTGQQGIDIRCVQ